MIESNGDTLKQVVLLNFEPTPTPSDAQVLLLGLQIRYPGFSVASRRLLTSTVSVSLVSFCSNSGDPCPTAAGQSSFDNLTAAIGGIGSFFAIIFSLLIISILVVYCSCRKCRQPKNESDLGAAHEESSRGTITSPTDVFLNNPLCELTDVRIHDRPTPADTDAQVIIGTNH